MISIKIWNMFWFIFKVVNFFDFICDDRVIYMKKWKINYVVINYLSISGFIYLFVIKY